jgi:hypothetical protein
MEPGDSFSYSQEYACGLYAEPAESSSHFTTPLRYIQAFSCHLC